MKYLILISVILISFNFANAQISHNSLATTNYLSCTDNDRCNYHGVCKVNNTICHCYDGYVTYNSDDGTQCNYKQKEQLTAFLLQFFLGTFGAGHFYIGWIAYGVGEIVLTFGICFVGCFFLAIFGLESGPFITLINYFLRLGIFGWWLANTIIFGLNNFNDSNGVSLKPM